MKSENGVQKWEKPELTILSGGETGENILSASHVDRNGVNDDQLPPGNN